MNRLKPGFGDEFSSIGLTSIGLIGVIPVTSLSNTAGKYSNTAVSSGKILKVPKLIGTSKFFNSFC